jgi:hypothetical protein
MCDVSCVGSTVHWECTRVNFVLYEVFLGQLNIHGEFVVNLGGILLIVIWLYGEILIWLLYCIDMVRCNFKCYFSNI